MIIALMVLGVYKNSFEADEAINNLLEAEFASDAISLVGINDHEISDIADVHGSLMHTSLKDLAAILTEHGLDSKNAEMYQEEVTNGAILLTIEAEAVAEDVAIEMLSDAGAIHVMAFPDTL